MGAIQLRDRSSLPTDPQAGWAVSMVGIFLEDNNMTAVKEFILLGFPVGRSRRILMFFLLLVVYYFTISMNLLIITLVSTSKILHTPMYFFISQLSISDILLTTDIVPKMLRVILYYRGTITFLDCMTQFYFFGVTASFECLLLTVMSYDRYVAICNPLRYSTIMTSGHCGVLTVFFWLVAVVVMLITIIIISKLNFCRSNIIDHFFCDFFPVMELSCSDTFIAQLEAFLLSAPLFFLPVIIIIFSYAKIIVAILRIPSSTGRQKAFSTCSSHLIVVSIFYGTLLIAYVFPIKGQTSTMSKILSLLYTVFTPVINPIIYSLKNKDIKTSLHKLIEKLKF